jgi:catechol 2,3-dioxygenase-like lactoylglutathione lyase family enzyme
VTRPVNREFDIRGINHLALVCSDMARTVEFYQGVLGMPLIKTIELPGGMGQHFFFDLGNGDALAFFWFPDAPAAHPGVTNPAGLPCPTSRSSRRTPR